MIPWLLRNHAGIERTSQCLRRHHPHLGHTPLRSFADHNHIQRDHQRDDDQRIGAHIKQIPVEELIGQIFEIGNLGPRREDAAGGCDDTAEGGTMRACTPPPRLNRSLLLREQSLWS